MDGLALDGPAHGPGGEQHKRRDAQQKWAKPHPDHDDHFACEVWACAAEAMEAATMVAMANCGSRSVM